MEAVALGTGRISLRSSLWKAIGCWVAIVTGSSIGREGPIIQIGAAIGGTVGERTGTSSDRTRILIAAGTAAGFASAYNTPFAAVLFVLEIVTGIVTLDVILATVLAAAISTAITRLAAFGGPIYGQRAFAIGSPVDWLMFVAVGAACGFVGAGFSALLQSSERLFARAPLRQPAVAIVGGAVVGAIAMALPDVTGNGYEAINRILDGAMGAKIVVVLLVAKAVATSVSVGSGIPGGAFTPSLFLGAALGGTIGHVMQIASPDRAHAPGAYALVGMAALCAATTHAPLMAAVLVFELSGDYAIVLPLLVATATATLISRRVRATSIYMDELRRRGITWKLTWSGREVDGDDQTH
jgi:CIC family chloride channel protein